ncbi:hypothetical protein GCM10010217_43790 [Streptomyces tubercidicus]
MARGSLSPLRRCDQPPSWLVVRVQQAIQDEGGGVGRFLFCQPSDAGVTNARMSLSRRAGGVCAGYALTTRSGSPGGLADARAAFAMLSSFYGDLSAETFDMRGAPLSYAQG